jgi:putative redox protein
MYHVVDLKYIIKLQNEADKDKMEKAVNLSQEKYCGVAAMFRSFAKLNFVVQYL